MRTRLILALAATWLVAAGGIALPATAQTPHLLACANLSGTFSATFDPRFVPEEVFESALSVQARGQCVRNGQLVQVTVSGTGRGNYGGLCGEIARYDAFTGNAPDVEPVELGDIAVTVAVTPSGRPTTYLHETWTIGTENIETAAIVISAGQTGAGNLVTRLLAQCPRDGGNDHALFTWTQTA